MGESKEGVIMVMGIPIGIADEQKNPIALVQAKLKEVEIRFKGWLANQSLPMEAAVVTATSAFQGAAIGTLIGTLNTAGGDASSSSLLPPPPNQALKQALALAGGPFVQARNFAVMTGANAGISCVMKRLRGGKEDVQSSMVAAFGSGALFTLVSGVGGAGGPNLATNAVTSGLFFALVQGGIFQLGQKFSQPPTEDLYYVKTKSMLSSLGLQNYEKNFKKGLLNDTTLPLLNDSALQDVKIPPGPRLIILNHIERDPELEDRRRGSR